MGFLVAGCWAFYAAARSTPITWAEPVLVNAICLTCPVVIATFRFNLPLSLYSVLFLNAATYALIGLMIETLRRQLRRAQ
jgi:hypothetical protein